MPVTPDITRSLYDRAQYAGGELSLAPTPIVTTFPGDTTVWQQSGDPWTVVNNDQIQLSNPNGNDDYIGLINGIQQTAPAEVTFRIRAAGASIANGLGNGYGLELILTDSGGMSGTWLADVTTNFPAGTWPEAEFEVAATGQLPNPSATLIAPLSTVADASSTLQAVPYYISAAYLSATGATTPGASEDSITPGSADAYDIQFQSTLSTTDGTTGIILGMGTASGGEAQYAKISSTGVVTYVGTNAAGITATVSGSTLTVTISKPPTDTSTAMPATNTATVPAYYLYAYIYAHGVGGLTLRNAEIFQTGAAAVQNGSWRSETIDTWRAAGVPMRGTALGLQQIRFYYGDPSEVDDRDSVTHSVAALSQFRMVVMNEPGQLTTARQQAVAQALIAAGVQLYGYVNIGVAESEYNNCIPPLSAITAALDRIAAFGYAGVFFDAAGHGTIPTEYLNYLKSYCAAKSPVLAVFANAHPQDALSTAVDTTALVDPPDAPILQHSAAGTALAAGTYTLGYTLLSYDGETILSPTTQVTIAAGDEILVEALSGFDDNTQGISLYMSEAAGSSTLRRVVDGTNGGYEGTQTTLTALPSPAAPEPPAANTAYVSNPHGIASTLGAGDWCLWESFYGRSDDQYAGVPEGGFQVVLAEYIAAGPAAHAQGVKVAGLAYALTGTALDDYTDQTNAYLLAAMLGWDAVSFGSSTASNQLQWGVLDPPPAIGTKLTTPVALPMTNATPMEWYAVTDEGVIWFQATDSPVARSSGTFFVGPTNPPIQIATPPIAAGVGRTTVVQEGSPDASTWSAYNPQSPSRYVRQTATLQS